MVAALTTQNEYFVVEVHLKDRDRSRSCPHGIRKANQVALVESMREDVVKVELIKCSEDVQSVFVGGEMALQA